MAYVIAEPCIDVLDISCVSGCPVDWPEWVPPAVRTAFVDRGVRQPWSHQARAAELAHGGHDVVVATGTASGKSLSTG